MSTRELYTLTRCNYVVDRIGEAAQFSARWDEDFETEIPIEEIVELHVQAVIFKLTRDYGKGKKSRYPDRRAKSKNT